MRANVSYVDEDRARRVVDALRARGAPAQVAGSSTGLSQFLVRVSCPDGSEALWDIDGPAGLEAQLVRDGVMIGFVPVIEGSEGFTDSQVVDAIVRTDYSWPFSVQRPTEAPPTRGMSRTRGTLRRFIESFRE
jgi:hypothetical protein